MRSCNLSRVPLGALAALDEKLSTPGAECSLSLENLLINSSQYVRASVDLTAGQGGPGSELLGPNQSADLQGALFRV